MRAALIDVAPDFAFFFGIRAWELCKLSDAEVVAHIDGLDRLRRTGR